MFEGRGATEVTIFNPGLTDSELSTLVTNFDTYRQRTSTVIITCGDQLNGVDISLKEMLEATIKQCSMSPAFKTKVGAEGNATISLSSRKKNLFKLALNSKRFNATGKTSYSIGDDSGTRTGSIARPFKTIVFRPYEQGSPSNEVDDWIIFPAADVEGNATIAFNIGDERGYTITVTAYDPGEKNYKVLIGDPKILIISVTNNQSSNNQGTSMVFISNALVSGETLQDAIYDLAYKSNNLIQWKNLNFVSGWSNHSNGFVSGQYRKLPNGLVEIKGLVKKETNTTIGENIATNLPISCRPEDNRVTVQWAYLNDVDNIAAGVFYKSDGTIVYAGNTTPKVNYVTIDYKFITNKKTALFFGDSITQGVGASSNNNRYSTLITNNLGYLEDNQGISGTVLQNTIPTQSNNGTDRYISAIINNFPDKVFILYGVNDLRYNNQNYTITNYVNNYSQILTGLINAGISPSNITIGSPSYINPIAYNMYSPYDNGNVSKHQAYVNATKDLAKNFKTKWGDVYNQMLTNGGNTLLTNDYVHPNDLGHNIIANAMINANFQS